MPHHALAVNWVRVHVFPSTFVPLWNDALGIDTNEGRKGTYGDEGDDGRNKRCMPSLSPFQDEWSAARVSVKIKLTSSALTFKEMRQNARAAARCFHRGKLAHES